MKRENIFWVSTLILCLFCACTKQDLILDTSDKQDITRAHTENNTAFYYYSGEKIFLTERTDKILIQVAPDADKEVLSSFLNSSNLKSSKINKTGKEFSNFAIFEIGNEKKFSDATIESFKSREGIISTSSLYQYKDGSYQGLTNDFIVLLKPTTSYEQLQGLAAKNNCTIGEENEFQKNQYLLSISRTSKRNAMQMANLFYETGLFEFSEPDFWFANMTCSNDPFFGEQWGLKNTGQNGGLSGIDIRAEQAWAITKGSFNIKIAVIDTGVDLTHPDLQANLLSGYDPTGNNTGGGPYLNDNHGTLVAGVIGALQNNMVDGFYEGISGVAPLCKIIPIVSGGLSNYATNSINWAWQNGADVINLSWSCLPVGSIKTAINNATTNGRGGKGCIVVAASGNDDENPPFVGEAVSFPGNLSNVIAVGAIDSYGNRKSNSNYGLELDVMAPGVGIYTTNSRQGLIGLLGPYVSASGTSMAAPHVAGIAALVLSVDPLYLTRQQVTDIILQSADRYPNRHNEYGYGLVDAHRAVIKSWISNWVITGESAVPLYTDATYRFGTPPASIAFNGWTLPSGVYEPNNGSNYSRTFNFTEPGRYTFQAHFTLPGGTPHVLSRTITVPLYAMSVPTLAVSYEQIPPEYYGAPPRWLARATALGHEFPDITYDWFVNHYYGTIYGESRGVDYIEFEIGPDTGIILSCRARQGLATTPVCPPVFISAP